MLGGIPPETLDVESVGESLEDSSMETFEEEEDSE